MVAIDDLSSFDIDGAELSLWVFKKTAPKGLPPRFNGRWIETTDALETALKAVVQTQRGSVDEVHAYGLLAQNNEASVLSLASDETHAGLMIDQMAAETPQQRVTEVKDLQNTVFYVIKLVTDRNIFYAIKKADASWKTKRARNMVSVFFSEDQLDVADKPDFDIHKTIDFFVVGENVLVKHKGNFESILNYKQAHKDDYLAMSAEPEFIGTFAELAVLTSFIGDNKIQLRRMSAIRQKAHYKDVNFMARLQEKSAEFGLNIVFDEHGQITPTLETCRDIIAALLDHRLTSAFSENIYDVPDAIAVAV